MQKKGSAVLEEILEDNQYYIDRTQLLEQEILGFPAVYIEGAAASGKTTAVRILLKHHPEVEQQIFSMKADESVRKFADRSAELLEKMQNGSLVWVVLDDVPGKLPRETEEKIVDFVRNLPGGCRLLMMGREDPPEGLLELFWKRKMAIWGQKQLCLNKAEIKSLAERMHAPLQAEEVIRVTGGWAGCVEVILRMAANQKQGREKITAEELRRSYEVHTYIHMQILDKLSMEEQLMMRNTRFCSWMNEELSSSFFGIPHGKQVLVRLERKGLFTYVKEKHHWKLSPLFAEEYSENLMPADTEIRKNLGEWYEEHGLIKEMLECLSQSGDKHVYWEALKRHYEKIPFLDIEYGEMLQAEDESPQACYLRGMYYFSHKKPEEGSREMFLLEKYAQENPSVYGEIYLNLGYADTELSLDQWLHLLEKYAAEKPVHLYEIMGNSFTYLCGRRDLSGLFACSKQEENRKAKLWRSCLCEREWMAYRLARFDYYLETERRAAIPEEDLFLTEQIVNGSYDWKIRLAVMNLLCKLQKIQYEEEREERICLLERGLLQEEYFSLCQKCGGNRLFLWIVEKETGKIFRVDAE